VKATTYTYYRSVVSNSQLEVELGTQGHSGSAEINQEWGVVVVIHNNFNHTSYLDLSHPVS